MKKPIDLKVNTVLFTKNGRKSGNAIVSAVGQYGVEIITDYGNPLYLKYESLEDYFHKEYWITASPDHKHFTPPEQDESLSEDPEETQEDTAGITQAQELFESAIKRWMDSKS